ncbi:hypothetical protein AVEN_95964-1 [Araneus ventricosus]|uniref:Uncharacterized protein n=1 Tax=Araneus ventricosus TaxID=182803 RepID=A0A4Y2R495_ARAVE|nr:hypothetical protein AVEN_95964-1 [Araneus ventricosus]
MADMLIFILEASRALELLSSSNTHNTNELVPKLLSEELGESYLKSIMANQSEETVKALILLNKIDLLSNEELVKIKQMEQRYPSVCAVSCIDGTGMQKFLNVLSERIKEL